MPSVKRRTTDAAVYRHDYLDRIYDRNDGTVVATYRYDALGRRIEKTVDDGVTPVTTRYPPSADLRPTAPASRKSGKCPR